MNIALISALAGVAAAGALAASAEAATPEACFYSRDITNWRGVGDKQVNLEINHRDIYRLDLARACSQLASAGEALILDAGGIGGPVCSSSLADVIVPRAGNFRCPVTKITKFSREEAKALPKKERP